MLLKFVGELLESQQVFEPLLNSQPQVLAKQSSVDIFLVGLDHGIWLKLCAGLEHKLIIGSFIAKTRIML